MPRWAAPPLPARLTAAGGPFVGRGQELERLEAVWAQVDAGAGQTVLVGGAAGTGKSRLTAKVAAALHAGDVAVLLGGCTVDLQVPYQPLVDALDHLLTSTDPGDLTHLIPPAAHPLGRVTPHLQRHVPELVVPADGAPGHPRELFDAFTALLEAVTAERPVALVLEDLHWASAHTRLLLDHLIRSTSRLRLLIVGTMRDTAADRSPELTQLVAEAYRLPHVHRLDLGGLSIDEITAYLAADGGVGDRDRAETAALLQQQTGGNPFFLGELWRDLKQRGGVQALRSRAFSAPRTVTDMLESRVRGFADVERECLELAAVLGDAVHVGPLAAASGHPRDEVLAALDRAAQHGLLTYDRTSGSFRFPHVLVRHAVQEWLAPSRSATLHLRLATAIEAATPSRAAPAALLARLYEGASALGYEQQRAHHLAEAAAQAQRGLAHEEAAQLWERAARAVADDGARAERLLLASADSLLLAGDFAQARARYREVASSADDRVVLRAAIGFEDASWRPGRGSREPLERLTAALDRVAADPTDATYVRALAGLARAHAFCGELEEARSISTRALHLARDLGDDRLVAEALVASLLQVMTTPGSLAVHHQRAVELRRIALQSGAYDQLAPAGCYRALTSYMAGSLEEWDAGRQDIERAAAATGQPFWSWVVGCFEHCQQFMAGDFAAAEATAERIRRLGSAFGPDDTDGPYGLQMFLLRRATGRLEPARALVGATTDDDVWRPGLLALATELGMDDVAQRLLWQLLGRSDELDRQSAVWPAVVVFLAEAAIRLADGDALEVVEPLVAEYQGMNLVAGQCVCVLGSADLLLAQIRALRGDAAAAEAHFEAALAADSRVRSAVHRAETLARYAAFLRARGRPGDAERAAAHRQEARALAESRGHRRVLDLLAESQASPGLPDGLTRRELDVLQLLAEGASNRDIAARLFISANTAANHVRSILQKTGSANRTQAAIYAADRHLVTTRTPPAPSRRAAPDRRSP